MFPVYCMLCFATIVFNTRVNVYFQGNRKCSFLPGCACLYLYWLTHITCFEINDDDIIYLICSSIVFCNTEHTVINIIYHIIRGLLNLFNDNASIMQIKTHSPTEYRCRCNEFLVLPTTLQLVKLFILLTDWRITEFSGGLVAGLVYFPCLYELWNVYLVAVILDIDEKNMFYVFYKSLKNMFFNVFFKFFLCFFVFF